MNTSSLSARALQRWVVGLLLCALPAAPSWGQGALTNAQVNLERFERTLQQIQLQNTMRADPDIPVNQRMLLEYGGTATFAFLSIDDSNQKTHILRQLTFVGFLHLNFDGAHDFSLRIRHSQRQFNHGDTFDPGQGDHDTVELTLDRAVYKFDLARYMGAYEGKQINGNLVIQAGRQLAHWANGLALSQEIDGGIITMTRGDFILDLLAGTTRRSSNDFDSSRPNFDNDTQRNFYGGKLTYRAGKHKPFIYGFFQDDENRNEFRVDALLGPSVPSTTTFFSYESYYIGAGSQGSLSDRLIYTLEAVYEGGHSRSIASTPAGAPLPGGQTDDPIEAWAVNAQLIYLLTGANRTKLSAEVLFASGDDDRGTASNTFDGNAPNTTDRSFNSFGYINTGLAFAPGMGNLMMLRLGATTFPLVNTKMFQKMQVGSDIFLLGKLDSEGAIDEATQNHSFLGTELDFFMSWQVFSDVTVSVRYGVFFPSQAIVGDSDERHFFYLGTTYAF